jgi:hypothetical protein
VRGASPAQTAAAVAALERFIRDTAPPTAGSPAEPDPWLQAAILEGVARDDRVDPAHPWINP